MSEELQNESLESQEVQPENQVQSRDGEQKVDSGDQNVEGSVYEVVEVEGKKYKRFSNPDGTTTDEPLEE